MKILVVAPCYHPAVSYGGPVVAIHRMNRELVSKGVDVAVYTTNANGPLDLDVPLDREVNVDGVVVRYFPVSKPRRYFYAPEMAAALKQNLHDFDCVHINWLYVYTTLVSARLCIKMGVPYLLTPHGMLDTFSMKLKGYLRKKFYISFIEKKHLSHSQCIHYASVGEESESVIKGWDLPSIVVPNGVDIIDLPIVSEDIYVKYPELTDKKLVLSMGRLNYIKGLDMLLEAWPFVVARVEDAHLVIAGPDSEGYLDELVAIARKGDVSESVTFTGMVVGGEKATLLNSADVFVSSSKLESFGMAIVEAMSWALPVVITDRVNIKSEIERGAAGLVTASDALKIAESIIYLLKNPKTSKTMGENGRKLVINKFSIAAATDSMVSLYNRIVHHTKEK